MAPLLDLSAQDNDDSSGPEEPEPTVQAPRVKHLWCQEDSYGYTKGRTLREKKENYFRLYPVAFVTGGKINSILFEVHFHLTKNKRRITIKHPDFYQWTKVCSKVMQDCGGEFADGGIVQRDFQALMESHIGEWSANTESYKIKQPVRNIGLQRHVLPPKFSDWRPEHFEFFFNSSQGVVNIKGEPFEDSQTVFVDELLKGVPQLHFSPSGPPGFAAHLQPTYTTDQTGDAYFESVCAGPSLAILSFHAPMFRGMFGKLGMPCIVGDPNMSKTKEIKSAMHMASSHQYLFANKSTPEFILNICTKVGLLISWDDNDSLRNEEVVGVVRFDGALVGTKKSGVQQLVGEICLTSNDKKMRAEKMKTGRVACLVKLFPGHKENSNTRLELRSLAALNEAMQDEKKPIDFLIQLYALWFKQVSVPDHLRTDPLVGESDSQIMVWFSQTAEKIREFNRCSMRECFTQAAWNMWPYLYDHCLPKTHVWWKNGGSDKYYSSYLIKQLTANADMYTRPLENPGVSQDDSFVAFVVQCLDGIDLKMETEEFDRASELPRQFVKELRLIYSTTPQSKDDKAMCLAFLCDVDYKEEFACDVDLSVFSQFIKNKGGNSDARVTVEYKGAALHNAMMIPLDFFSIDLRKRLVNKLVRKRVKAHCLVYGYDDPNKPKRAGGSRRRKNRSQAARSVQATTDGDMDMGDENSESETVRVNAGEAESSSTSLPATVAMAAPVIPQALVAQAGTSRDSTASFFPDGTAVPEASAVPEAPADPDAPAVCDAQAVLDVPVVLGTPAVPDATVPTTMVVDPRSASLADATPLANSLNASEVASLPVPTPSSPSGSQLLATAPSSPALGFVDDLLGFTAGLMPKSKQAKLFDPAIIVQSSSSAIDSGDSDDDGTGLFKTTAMSKVDKNSYEIPRTRSQSNSLEYPNKAKKSPHKKSYKKGDLIYAHKGKVVPCWFPGLISSKGKNGTFRIQFLADFGQKDCVASSMMPFQDYATREVEDAERKLFVVPKKLFINFSEAQKQANAIAES